MQPLISVIVPVFNAEKYLDECLESIVAQTYENIEVILVNDDSKDNSTHKIAEWVKKDKRVSSLSVKHHNAALTRNSGIEKANGSYLCFVDSDDIIGPNYVKLLFKALQKNDAAISSVKIMAFLDGDKVSVVNNSTAATSIVDDLVEYFFDHYKWDLNGDYIAQSINAKMFKKKNIENIDYTVLKTSILEDNYIVPQVLKRARPQSIALVDSVEYYYRQRQGSTQGSVLDGPIEYGDKKIDYPELFDITINYVASLFKDHKSIDLFVHKLKAQEYSGIAKFIVGRNMKIKQLSDEIDELEKSAVDQTLLHKKELTKILNSKAYRIGSAALYPYRFLQKRLHSVKSK